jgi:hypothetical protein
MEKEHHTFVKKKEQLFPFFLFFQKLVTWSWSNESLLCLQIKAHSPHNTLYLRLSVPNVTRTAPKRNKGVFGAASQPAFQHL